MTAYYNENDPYPAAWLRNLISAGLIAAGDVDERDIRDVRPDDLRGYTQCHFFAGIGGWSLAARLAGWPDDRPLWTGSCPCQPFSAAGRQDGFADERHLWPSWFHLIGQCRPPIIFGEQVASKATGPWIDLVHDDLETLGYTFGAIPFPAAGIGAPHIRDRLWWVADAAFGGSRTQYRESNQGVQSSQSLGGYGLFSELADTTGGRLSRGRRDAGSPARPGEFERQSAINQYAETWRRWCAAHGASSFWSNAEWIACRDGKARSVEPGTFPLAYGISGRVGKLRAYGNAIVPQAAAEFIAAYVHAQTGF